MATSPDSARKVAASCAIALVLGLAACGNDDDSDAANDGGSSPATKPDAAKPAALTGTDEEQVKALVARVGKAFVTADQGEVICDSLTDRGQRDIVAYGHAVGLPGPCAEVADGMIKRELDAKTEQRPTKVVSVRVRGQQAVALLRIDGASSLQQRYRKQDGQWKIGSFHLAGAVGAKTQ